MGQVQTVGYSHLESKSFWTLEELSNYLGYSKSYIYKLTSTNSLPYYKFNGKVMFGRDEIFERIKSGLVKSNEQLKQEVLFR